ncbi:hypothetical protein A1E_01195 [Rickettsia canadensis str. McKiel]|uniref:Uncharacterized protein n=1 Tax=Rickettsia canadensis (strain McKiel) TaxID=293613 RepID=A8EXV1_RICCK|nr:hypothetical protein A1E_01195 [Rickettsia canadensis str. McKiel]
MHLGDIEEITAQLKEYSSDQYNEKNFIIEARETD